MAVTDPRIPASILPLLENYLRRLQAEVPDLLLGVYLHGSTTYDAFCEQSSDIDVLAVTTRSCRRDDLASLAQIHADLRAAWPQWKLEVSYVPEADCGRWRPGVATPHPYHHHDPYQPEGVFTDSGIFDFNSPLWAANLWWMVITRGIVLLGPEPAALGVRISASDIVATSQHLVESHWPQWTRPQERLFKLLHAFDVDWVVLGTLRTYFTLRENDIISKPGAVEYGLTHLPKRWHWLIRKSVENRLNPARRGAFTRILIAIVATLYLRFMLRECRRIIAND